MQLHEDPTAALLKASERRHKERKPEGKTSTIRTSSYQKQYNEHIAQRLLEQDAKKITPFISNELFEELGEIADSLDLTRPSLIGSILRIYVSDDVDSTCKKLSKYRDQLSTQSEIPVIPDEMKDKSKYHRHIFRQKQSGLNRRSVYMREDDIKALKTLQKAMGIRSQGDLVEAILSDFLSAKIPKQTQDRLISDAVVI